MFMTSVKNTANKGLTNKLTSNKINSLYIFETLVGEVVAGFTPLDLFQNGEQGGWYDPSDLSTLFQDDAGTTPVTADGDPVGLMLDKSGNGNNATQSVSAARPTYRTDGTLHWLEFDGVDDWMGEAVYDAPLITTLTIFNANTYSSNVSDLSFAPFSLGRLSEDSSPLSGIFSTADDSSLRYQGSNTNPNPSDLPSSPATLSVATREGLRVDAWFNLIKNIDNQTRTSSTGTSTNLFLGGNENTTFNQTNFYGGGAVFDVRVSDDISLDIRNYLATKSGVTL